MAPLRYRVASAGEAGKGLFATEPLSPGEVVLELARPMVTALDTPALAYACEWCFDGIGEAALGQAPADNEADMNSNLAAGAEAAEGVTKLSRCTGCKLVRYCSKACQSQAWKHHHKLECKIFASIMPRTLPNATRMMIQILLRRQKGMLSDQEWDSFLALQHHLDDFKKMTSEEDNVRRLRLSAMATKQYCGLAEGVDQVESWISRIYINAQTLVTPIFHPLGQCLDPLPASINHSCIPNAVVVFSGPLMTIRCTSDIPKGEEITISYIDPTSIAGIRKWELQERYFFECNCRACAENLSCNQPDPPQSFRNSKDAIAVLNSLASLDEAGLDAQQASESAAKEGQILQSTQSESAATPERHYLELCRGLSLYLQQENIDIYPAGRQPFAHLRSEVVIELLARQHFVAALVLSLQSYYDADPMHFPFVAHPVRVVHAYTLSKLAYHVHYSDAVGDRLARALSREFGMDGSRWASVSYALLGEVLHCIGSSHGDNSRLAQLLRSESLMALRIPQAKELIEAQRFGPKMGIRDVNVWRGPARAASEGWKWFRSWMLHNVVTEKLDHGLQMLLLPKQEDTPTLLRPTA